MKLDDSGLVFRATGETPNMKQLIKFGYWWLPLTFASGVLVSIVEAVTHYRYEQIIGSIPTAFFLLAPLVFAAYLTVRRRRKYTIGVADDGVTVNGRLYAFGDLRLGRWQVPQLYGEMPSGAALHLRSGDRRFVLGGRDYRVATKVRLEVDPVNRVNAWMWDSDFAELVTRIPGLDARETAPGQPVRCLLFRRPSRGKVDPTPSVAIDLGADTITVINPDNDATVAACALTEVTATPAEWTRPERYASMWTVLVVDIPGTEPLSITCLDPRLSFSRQRAYRFSWRDQTSDKHDPAYLVSAADWLTLVEKLGLAPRLADRARTAGPAAHGRTIY